MTLKFKISQIGLYNYEKITAEECNTTLKMNIFNIVSWLQIYIPRVELINLSYYRS